MTLMKAIRCTAYGPPDVLRFTDVPKPVPRENEILIKIKASTVTLGDCELRNLTLPTWTRIPLRLFMGYSKPRNFITGMELAGIVEETGRNVRNFKTGDAVFCSGGMTMGANAEYICRPEGSPIAFKPHTVSFGDAATIMVGGINALHFLRKARIQPGQKVLIIGAGGSIGTYGVQLAKLSGAVVTAVDHHSKSEMLRSIGADEVIDYSTSDFSKSGIRYDVIFDMIFNSSFSKCINSLSPHGCYLMANTDPLRMLQGAWLSRKSGKKVYFSLAGENVPDMNLLAGLIAEGKIKPVIDRTYSLDMVPEAHRYVEQNLKKGCIIVNH